jgi:hypothetical protein
MSERYRRTIGTVGIAAGALLAAPLISLLGSPVAGADPDVTTLGPYDVDGSISYIDNFFGIDFIPTDAGLTLLG